MVAAPDPAGVLGRAARRPACCPARRRRRDRRCALPLLAPGARRLRLADAGAGADLPRRGHRRLAARRPRRSACRPACWCRPRRPRPRPSSCSTQAERARRPCSASSAGSTCWRADAPERIARLARAAQAQGPAADAAGPAPTPTGSCSPRSPRRCAAMVEHGLVFDALVRAAHLPRMLTLCRRHPDAAHRDRPRRQARHRARRRGSPGPTTLARIADADQRRVQAVGPADRGRRRRRAHGAARRWAQHCSTCFGAQRLLWGSDWPVLELAASYATWWDETQALLAGLRRGRARRRARRQRAAHLPAVSRAAGHGGAIAVPRVSR